jgi:adenine-specific DNA-methyltransferase
MTNTPEKMTGISLDIAADQRARLKQLFPTVFTETANEAGELVESVDFEKLKTELGTFTDLFENRRERYGMDWPGKKEALKLIQTPSTATLKPCREESVNFDTTENLFIEGDNLEVLKLLQKSYYGKVKMIYIDPPYNTGNEFIYPDNFAETLATYLEYAGLIDGEGKKFSTNTANEGRFHSKWLNMMYPRLYLARNLLRDDGVIFISIDDNEVSNLRKLCDEIFGEENFVASVVWQKRTSPDSRANLSAGHDYLLIYALSIDDARPTLNKLPLKESRIASYKNPVVHGLPRILLDRPDTRRQASFTKLRHHQAPYTLPQKDVVGRWRRALF